MNPSYKRLVIDTATKYIYLALVVDDIEVDSVYQVGDNNHSVTIMPLLEEMLQKQHIELTDINEVIVGIGPGSYTGVRIGVTVAKMIGYLNQIVVKEISSLALMASHSNKAYVLPLIDARRGNAFMALFENKTTLKYLYQDVLKNIEVFKSNINQDYEIIKEGKPDIQKIIQSDLLKKVEDIHELVPNYLQVTEAERNLKND